jgi:hypothetical protein
MYAMYAVPFQFDQNAAPQSSRSGSGIGVLLDLIREGHDGAKVVLGRLCGAVLSSSVLKTSHSAG